MRMMIKQKGAALLLSLVILLVLTLLAVSGMQGSTMQERMSTAQRDGMFALEIAETAMREAEATLDGLSDLSGFGSTTGFYDGTLASTTVPSPFSAATWGLDGSGNSQTAIKGTAVNGVDPQFMFEYKGKVVVDSQGQLPRDFSQYGSAGPAEFDYARILVRTAGPSGSSMRLLEGFYVFQPGGLAGGNP
ncbi:pilus assembly PilX family protein [Marinobacter xiaoshiensis]|uniref:PilX N-terminal domain-containing pilus assembly protein n=1 Tax=Marinobacter xiaoshiensis TaxID=3073652 RepID=A0ABU2HHM2_9GAMM|nr:PilX N-terminal domain-containing pilus assembly protein [Marinobacter sp. F60267]MDS1310567.1 PilX N-terminal domain-containing pilus assembly protein [Marinobacter sp. F60267]